jgi:hypothetical protein
MVETDITNSPAAEPSDPAAATTGTPAKKPVSQAKLDANRRNGALSHGPKTEAGKAKSSLNALRTGIFARQVTCMTPEDLAEYQAHMAAIREELQPQGPREEFLCASIGDNMFRIARIRAVEHGTFANGYRKHVDSIQSGHEQVDTALAAARTFEEQAHQLSLLTVYESRIRRTLTRDQQDLDELQEERERAYERAAGDAIEMMRYAESQDAEYDPGDDFTPARNYGGFVFSADDLNRRRDRNIRFKRAWRSNREPKPDHD